MKKILLLLLILFARAQTFGATVSEKEARTIGYNFLLAHGVNTLQSPDDFRVAYTSGEQTIYFYVLTTSSCYVVVAADKVSIPVLGYSTQREFKTDKIPDGLQFMFECYTKQIKYGIEHQSDPPQSTLNKWSKLNEAPSASGGTKSKTTSLSICPLLNSEWDQEDIPGDYNMGVPGGHYQGCVATAMGQIMNYWQWPANGVGFNAYYNIWTGDFISSDFAAHPFDWANAAPSLYPDYRPGYPLCSGTSFPGVYGTPAYTPACKAISNIQFQAGISVNMQYDFMAGLGDHESFAWPSDGAAALAGNFLYNGNFSNRDPLWYIDEAPWLNYINSNLNNGQPVMYAGFAYTAHFYAHCWVIDGYDADGFYNMNWGWQGYDEGIFTLNHLTPPGEGEYDWVEQAVLDIYPYCPTDIVTYPYSGDIAAGGGYNHGGINMGSHWGSSSLMVNNPGANQWFTGQFIEVENNFLAYESSGSTFFELVPNACSPHGGHRTSDTSHALSIQRSGSGSSSISVGVNDINTNGIPSKATSSDAAVYPNPAQDKITISWPCKSPGNLDISIKDVAGRTMYTESLNCVDGGNVMHTVDVSSFIPGMYYIDLTQNEMHVVKKIVKLAQ